MTTEHRKEIQARYRAKHRERIAREKMEWYYANHEKALQQHRSYKRRKAALKPKPPRPVGMDYILHWSVPEPNSGCWLWLGSVDRKGYGRADRRLHGIGLAHRLAFTLNGSDPGELLVCHRCDQPGCVNPEHLFAGTPKDNTQDMVRKGRARGRNSKPLPSGRAGWEDWL